MEIGISELIISFLNILLLLGSIAIVGLVLYLVYKAKGHQKKISELENRIKDLETNHNKSDDTP